METDFPHTKDKGFDAFTLKMLAIIGMTMQHTAIALGPLIPVALHFPLQLGGGFTFPIMAMLLVEGYKHTRNVKKYMLRLFVFAAVSQVPHMMTFSDATIESPLPGINIMLTLFVGLLLLYMHDNMKSRGLFWFLFIVISLATFMFDWGVIGPIMILLYHIATGGKMTRTIVPILAAWFNTVVILFIILIVGILTTLGDLIEYVEPEYLPEIGEVLRDLAGLMFPVGMLAVIPFVRNYNGQRGRSNNGIKYMFYIFYPLHLLILGVLRMVLL